MMFAPPCRFEPLLLYLVSNPKFIFVFVAGFNNPAVEYLPLPLVPAVAKNAAVWKPPPVMNPVPPFEVVMGMVVSPVNV